MKTKIVIGLLIFSIIVTIAFGFNYRLLLLDRKENNDCVFHTYLVIQKNFDLLSTLKDAETGQRGYIYLMKII